MKQSQQQLAANNLWINHTFCDTIFFPVSVMLKWAMKSIMFNYKSLKITSLWRNNLKPGLIRVPEQSLQSESLFYSFSKIFLQLSISSKYTVIMRYLNIKLSKVPQYAKRNKRLTKEKNMWCVYFQNCKVI